jgi:hypothetical protein
LLGAASRKNALNINTATSIGIGSVITGSYTVSAASASNYSPWASATTSMKDSVLIRITVQDDITLKQVISIVFRYAVIHLSQVT